MKRNIRLTIEYDGSRYQGWQRLGGDSNANTIQGKLESVLSKMTGEDVNINGSGRTDAGVHAYGQVANFHTDCMMSVNEIKDYLTKYLPSDIGIVEVSEASERFHSRLNAKEKLIFTELQFLVYRMFLNVNTFGISRKLWISKRWKKLHHY